MTPQWREMYDWAAFARFSGPTQWELIDLDDPWVCMGYVIREGLRKYRAISNSAGLPQPSKPFRSLKQAKAWVQALAVLNQ